MSNVRVDIGRILSPPWNGLGAFAYMDILNCSSGDFIWQPESDRSCQCPTGIGRQHAISRPDTEPLRERRLIGNTFGGSRPVCDRRAWPRAAWSSTGATDP